MKDVKFNYHLESKEIVIKQLKLYLDTKDSKLREYKEEEEKCKNEICRIKNIKKNVESKHCEETVKRQSKERERDRVIEKKCDNLRHKEKSSEKILERSLKFLIFIPCEIKVIRALNNWVAIRNDEDFFQAFIVSLIIVFPLIKFIVFPIVDCTIGEIFRKNICKKYENKIISIKKEGNYGVAQKTSKEISLYKEYSELNEELWKLEEKIKDTLPKAKKNSILNLNKKFNIPNDIFNYEEVVYNLLVTNRVKSFNEALDRVEVYKHRKYLEKKQNKQYLETKRLQDELNDMSNDFYNMNRELNNQFKNNEKLINEVKNIANKASEAAANAADEAANAAYSAADAAWIAKKTYYSKM